MVNSRTTKSQQSTTEFLLEIGVEEIPAADLDQALEQIYAAFIELKQKKNLNFSNKDVQVMGTPRRIAVLIKNFPLKQEDETSKRVKGPPADISFKDGKPTKAAFGFAKTQGVKLKDLKVEPTEKGDYLFAVFTKPGLESKKILSQELSSIIESLDFDKSMRWNSGKIRFIRPIRWLVAMFGSQVIDFTYASLKSSNTTLGHRILSPRSHRIDEAATYVKDMNKVKVIVENEKRAKIIEKAINEIVEGHVDMDDLRVQKTFCEVINLVEAPSGFVAQFDKRFLKLPKKVVETVLQSHQRYFPIVKKSKSSVNLTNSFFVVQNGDPKYKELIKHGHEKVVRARLEDAEFYFAEDSRKKLSARVKDLDGIVFHERLGTLLDKTKRLKYLVENICEYLDISKEDKKITLRAAELAKADLLTSMVAEFDELQGFVGAEYALREGESAKVAKAIGEQYLPKHAKDERPKSKAASLLAIADRLDTICAYISIGILPTSAGDPYALRRQATGLVDIIFDRGFHLSLSWAAKLAYKRLSKDFTNLKKEQGVVKKFSDLVNQRVEFRLSQTGVDYDIIRAVAGLKIEQPVDFRQRVLALQSVRETDKKTLDDLTTICNRAYSIAQSKYGLDLDQSLLEEEAEIIFYKKLLKTEKLLESAIADKKYENALKILSSLKEPIDRFFDEVLVMAKEAKLKRNRNALLNNFVTACQKVADLSKIVKS